MIEIKNLSVSYKNKINTTEVIEHLKLHIPKGEICAIIGPSGGGKSTLLKVLAGIIRDYRGQVLMDGKEIDPKCHRIGFIPQQYGLIKWKTVEQNILLSSKVKDGRKNIDKAFYEYLLNKLDIQGLKTRYPRQLSGGQMQRVSIARAFLLKPNLLLMDESFSALDTMTREHVQKLFLEVWKECKVTTLLVTHDINEAIFLGSKIIIFSSLPGNVVQIIENPLFGKTLLEEPKAYMALNKELRKNLKR